ncbi:alpha/beta hydrolase [Candidatus Bathyarchaeota archaeon]|nr:alpha/beta hydrolase [Candidatus Bathyarchaeota archaeon]
MEEKPVFFVNEGERLVGMLHVPDETPAPIVVFCHGFTGHRIEAHRLFVHAARAFCRHGFLALRFDFRGSGESEGLFQSMTVSGEVSDLKAAISWVENLDEVEKDRVGVVGLSLGGVVVILTASQDDRIRAVAAWSAPADLSEVAKGVLSGVGLEEVASRGYLDLPSGYRVGYGFVSEAYSMKHAVLSAVSKISPRPLLIVHGTEDQVVPPSHAERLYKTAGEPKSLFMVEGADHTFSRWELQWKVINHTVEWFEENLK